MLYRYESRVERRFGGREWLIALLTATMMGIERRARFGRPDHPEVVLAGTCMGRLLSSEIFAGGLLEARSRSRRRIEDVSLFG
jgi:hypothetical protein